MVVYLLRVEVWQRDLNIQSEVLVNQVVEQGLRSDPKSFDLYSDELHVGNLSLICLVFWQILQVLLLVKIDIPLRLSWLHWIQSLIKWVRCLILYFDIIHLVSDIFRRLLHHFIMLIFHKRWHVRLGHIELSVELLPCASRWVESIGHLFLQALSPGEDIRKLILVIECVISFKVYLLSVSEIQIWLFPGQI